ncbi:MAG: DUF3137 domain-containing protein [Candidatus Saccharibacteria bacterium]|nr:DUF3137 domain-containing protein [Candidatus Saccharibacteria bacterium]
MNDLEKMRQEIQAIRKRNRKTGIFVWLGIASILFIIFSVSELSEFTTGGRISPLALIPLLVVPLVFPGAFVLIVTLIVTSIQTKPKMVLFGTKYKEEFILKPLLKKFKNIVYYPGQGMNREVIRGTGMMTGDRYRANDFVAGSYKDVRFSQSDVHIENEHTDSDGDTYYVTVFKGRWMVFEFRRNFRSEVQVISKGFSGAIRKRERGKIETEDVEFNEMFEVLTTDGMEAFYILTPDMMEKIKALVKDIGDEVMFCFKDKLMHVGVNNNRDSFEPDLKKEIKVDEILAQTEKEMKLITDVVDGLEIDERIFKIG